jgi:Fe-S cluster biogenesis protein NfuA
VANDGEFQEQIRQLGKLVTEFDRLPDSSAKVSGRELVQLLMDLHGAGLERMMEIVFESGSAKTGAIIDKLGQDSITGSLLLLYSLHPEPLETRVEKALGRMRPRLRKLASSIELLSVQEGVVEVRLATAGHSCGSSANDLRSIVEESIYEFAPDVTAVEIRGLDEPAAAGFVALESLLGHHLAAAPSGQPLEREGGD